MYDYTMSFSKIPAKMRDIDGAVIYFSMNDE